MTPAGQKLDRHLAESIEHFKGVASDVREKPMRGPVRLRNMIETIQASIDRECDKAAEELAKKGDECRKAVQGAAAHVGQVIDAGTQQTLDMLSQMTNDPLSSSGSSASDVSKTPAGTGTSGQDRPVEQPRSGEA